MQELQNYSRRGRGQRRERGRGRKEPREDVTEEERQEIRLKKERGSNKLKREKKQERKD